MSSALNVAGMQDNRAKMEYVKIGDECSFEGMGGGLLIGDCALSRLGIEEKNNDRVESSTKSTNLHHEVCVFKLLPMLSYRARQEFEAKREEMREREQLRVQRERSNGETSGAEDESDADIDRPLDEYEFQLLKELELSEQNEEKSNDRAPIEQNGSVLHYGDVVQLLHVHSNLFVKFLDKAAALDRDCNAVELGKGGEDCYFVLKPRFKTRSVGSPVYYDDELMIVSLKLNFHIHGSQSKFYSSPTSIIRSRGVANKSDNLGFEIPYTLLAPKQREINCSRDFFSFRINFYQRVGDDHLDDLRTHSGFRLFHQEAESFLQASGSTERKGVRADGKTGKHIPYLRSFSGSLNAQTIVEGRLDPNLNVKGLWCFESRMPSRGSAIGFNMAIRIKHIPSRKYLSCQTSSTPNSELFDCILVDGIDPSAGHGSFGSPHSLDFYILPQDIIEVSNIPQDMSTMVRIEHVHSEDGTRLHLLHTDKPKVPCYESSSAPDKPSGRGKGTMIAFSRQQAKQDILKLIPCSKEETLLVNRIIAKRYILMSYQWQVCAAYL